jgi:hypothetical protein
MLPFEDSSRDTLGSTARCFHFLLKNNLNPDPSYSTHLHGLKTTVSEIQTLPLK